MRRRGWRACCLGNRYLFLFFTMVVIVPVIKIALRPGFRSEEAVFSCGGSLLSLWWLKCGGGEFVVEALEGGGVGGRRW